MDLWSPPPDHYGSGPLSRPMGSNLRIQIEIKGLRGLIPLRGSGGAPSGAVKGYVTPCVLIAGPAELTCKRVSIYLIMPRRRHASCLRAPPLQGRDYRRTSFSDQVSNIV